jgi:hypothetical protein
MLVWRKGKRRPYGAGQADAARHFYQAEKGSALIATYLYAKALVPRKRADTVGEPKDIGFYCSKKKF